MKTTNLFVSMFIAVSCVCLTGCYRDSVDDPTKENGDSTKEQIVIGEFSVSAYQKVMFSKGNLQYQASTDTWRFAPHQYDYVGKNNSLSSPSYSGWIDRLSWGIGDNPISDYYYNEVWKDWGENAIGDISSNVYRTLSGSEWDYLFNLRFDADQLWSQGTVNGVRGVIILPDNFSKHLSVSWKAQAKNYETNTYSINEWTIMENGGAIFLPAANDDNTEGSYWSSTPPMGDYYYNDGVNYTYSYETYCLYFDDDYLDSKCLCFLFEYLYHGDYGPGHGAYGVLDGGTARRSVRLVKDL